MLQTRQFGPHTAVVSAAQVVGWPQELAPGAHAHPPGVETKPFPVSHADPHCDAVQLGIVPGGAGHGAQLAPQTETVSAAHVAGCPQLFDPTAQVQPPAPSGTKPLAESHAKEHLPAVQVGVAPTGVVFAQSTQFGPQAAVVSRAQVVAAPQTFVPVGQAQPPALSGTKPFAMSQVKPHWPLLHDGIECGGDGQTLQPGPQLVTVSALHVVAPLQAFVPAAQTQAPTPSKTNPGWQVKEQVCCDGSMLLVSQKTFALGMA